MKTITNEFKNEMPKLGRQFKDKINIYENIYLATQDDKLILTQNDMKLIAGVSDTEIEKTLEDDVLFNIDVVRKGNMLSTMMKELDFESYEDIKVGNIVEYEFGLRLSDVYVETTDTKYQAGTKYYELDDGEYILLIEDEDYEVGDDIETTLYNTQENYEWINYGKYIIYSKEFNEDTKTYSYVCYDNMLKSMVQVDDTSIIQGVSVQTAITNLANRFKYNINFNTIGSKNLINIDEGFELGYINSSGEFVSENITALFNQYIPVEQNTAYVFSTNTSVRNMNVVYYNSNKEFISRTTSAANISSKKITTPANTAFMRFQFSYSSQDTMTQEIIESVKLMAQTGQTPTPYEPYIAPYSETYSNLSNVINENAFTDTEMTYRDVLDQICQALGTTMVIENNNLILKSLQTQVVDTIGKEFLKDTNVSFGKKYGPINSLVLSRSDNKDNSVINDETSIKNNGLTQFTIKDNRILLFEDRDDYRQSIFDNIKGVEYYLSDYSSTGVGYLEFLDFYNIQIDSNTYKCLMLNSDFKIKSGISEEFSSEEPEEATNDYQTSTKSTKEVSFIVDQQNGKIAAKVSKGEVINEINLDETGASINANKISLAGKTIALTSDDITINSTNFNVDKNGNITANNATFNSGTFKGDLDTSENCKVGNDLYIGQNQDTSNVDLKHIWFDTRQHIYRVHTTFNGLTVLGDDVLHLKIDDDTDIQLHEGNISFKPEGSQEMYLEDGYIWMADDPVISSDERLKENIKDIDTSWIDDIKVKEFAYKRTPDKKRIGVIAQDYIDKDYAEYFLEQDKDGYYAIRYNDITNALVKYCQELKQRVDTLEERIKEMEDK